MRVTQAQIAKRLGISQVAVSHALRGTSQASPHTQRRVRNLARRLGYRLNTSARATATGRFGAVAFLRSVYGPRSWYPVEMVDGIEDALEQRGLRLQLSKVSDTHLIDDDYVPSVLSELSVDGLIVNYLTLVPDRLVKLLDRFAVPAIWVNVRHEHNCVLPEDVGMGRAATEHLLAAGHRKIAFAHLRSYGRGPSNPSFTSPEAPRLAAVEDRLAGYSKAMADAGLNTRMLDNTPDDYPEHHIDVARQWLSEADRPTAIFAYSMPEAIALGRAADQLGLSVPGDLSIVATEVDTNEGVMHRLDAITVPMRAMGVAAVEQVEQRIADRGQALPPLYVPFEPVQARGSVAAISH